MTKSELIEKIAKDAGIPQSKAKIAFESTFEGIKSGLKKQQGYLGGIWYVQERLS